MKNNLKKEFHYFLLTDYEAEEQFLREKSNEGYRLMKVSIPGIYTFEMCMPEDVVYRLDFNPQTGKDRESYLQMFRDYGWEYMQDMNDYSYFRKPAGHETGVGTEIFSDDESRLEMLKRIFYKRMIPILLIFALCVMPQVIRGFGGEVQGTWVIGYFVLWGILFAVYLHIFIHCSIGFYKLRKTYSHEKE